MSGRRCCPGPSGTAPARRGRDRGRSVWTRVFTKSTMRGKAVSGSFGCKQSSLVVLGWARPGSGPWSTPMGVRPTIQPCGSCRNLVSRTIWHRAGRRDSVRPVRSDRTGTGRYRQSTARHRPVVSISGVCISMTSTIEALSTTTERVEPVVGTAFEALRVDLEEAVDGPGLGSVALVIRSVVRPSGHSRSASRPWPRAPAG